MDPQRAVRRARLAQLVASTGPSAEMHPRRAAVATLAAATTAAASPASAPAARPGKWVPAPPKYSVVYDGGAGYDPGNTDARSVGQYADTNNMVVHTTKGFNKRAIAQDVGQVFGASVLDPGQREFFTKLLLGRRHPWTNLHGANPQGTAGATGDEAFSDYYALAATGGLKQGESLAWGDVPIDREKLKRFGSALRRLGLRQGLKHYKP